MDELKVALSIQQCLKLIYLALQKRICEFVQIAGDQRLPVSKSLIQERARMTAEEMNLIQLSASNG